MHIILKTRSIKRLIFTAYKAYRRGVERWRWKFTWILFNRVAKRLRAVSIFRNKERRKSPRKLFCGAQSELVLLHSVTSSQAKARCYSSLRCNVSSTNRKSKLGSSFAAQQSNRDKALGSGEGIKKKESGTKKRKETIPLWKYNIVQKLTYPKIYLSSPLPRNNSCSIG